MYTRIERARLVSESLELQAIAKAHCANDVVAWINDWCWTYDPRVLGKKGKSPHMPFVLWPKQIDLLNFMTDRVNSREEMVVEKSRDVGATYLFAAFALHRWIFDPGFKTTFGSRKSEEVDKLGDPDTIFEKIRIILRYLPHWMRPNGFKDSVHNLHMRLLNPENENIVSGQGGDNMGRGGRSTLYVIDEAAFIERADAVDAATSATSDCRAWVSSVNGMGSLFARKRFGGELPVFRFHWSDDPRKDQTWAREKRRSLANPVVWAQEYDIDYTASVEGICIPAKWVQAAVDLPKLVDVPRGAVGVGGLDVGGGKAKSVFVPKWGPVVGMPESWGDPDTINTANKSIDHAKAVGVKYLNYDVVGVGLGVQSAFKHVPLRDLIVSGINTGDAPSNRVWDDERSSRVTFANLKAELWWIARCAFQATYEHVAWIRGDVNDDGEKFGVEHPLDELIALPNCIDLQTQLSLPKWFKNVKGKIIIETKDQLARRGVSSPDFAEAFMLCLTDGTATPLVVAPDMPNTAPWNDMGIGGNGLL